MANLSTILADRIPQTVLDTVNASATETNLKDGKTWSYTPAYRDGGFARDIVWVAPGTGTAIVEIWGPGGSGAGGCCCFGGIPGNAGAYVKKTVTVAANDYVCSVIGISCGNASTICFRGCGTATCTRICTAAGGCICLCAMSGIGGYNICNPSSSIYCCFIANGFCFTNLGAGCGIICNNAGLNTQGQAYGGDINCPGCLSCMTFWICNVTNNPNLVHIAYPAGIFSDSQGWLVFEDSSCYSDVNWSSIVPYSQAMSAMNGQSMGFTQGATIHCWSTGQCGCYCETGCYPFQPPGMPGASGPIRAGQNGRGQRGGHGAMKITFIGS